MRRPTSLGQLERIADSLEYLTALLSPVNAGALDGDGDCWRWQATPFGGRLSALPRPEGREDLIGEDLIGLDDETAQLTGNTKQFLRGQPANHALLTGARGCGKSSLIRNLCAAYAGKGLRWIETDTAGLAALAHLAPALAARDEKYILFCDDLSFPDSASPLFNPLKSAIEGALAQNNRNFLIYATSNRRHLVSETFADNLAPLGDSGEINPMETTDEKIALSDRFGLWIPFYEPGQDEYDALVRHYLKKFGIRVTRARVLGARQYADTRGARNGRTARNYATAAITPNANFVRVGLI